jgi:hypothetical protein
MIWKTSLNEKAKKKKALVIFTLFYKNKIKKQLIWENYIKT